MTSSAFDLGLIGSGLPVAGVTGEFAAALGSGSAVVQAPPGTGKTTLLPPAAANALGEGRVRAVNPGSPRRVVVTQPRRVAARAAATRLARLTGTAVGELAGYTVRGERSVTARTLVEFVTPGILLRRLLQDPELPGVAAVLLDEVHERGLESDLLVGMLAELRQLREDLRLVAMSATLDAERFARLLPTDRGEPASVISCPSVLHPLEVDWTPYTGHRIDDRGVSGGFLDHVAGTAARAHRDALTADPGVDALVFVPGAWEVARVAQRIRARTDAAEILELHGRVGPRDQDRAVSGRGPGDPPRIVVATSLAESSLTVPGVRLVVDSGLSREPRRDTVRGMSGLVTVAASRASAEQRAGRAARLGPGRVIRCYDERAWAAMPAQSTPEAASADLTQAVLTLAVWGAPRGEGLSLPDPLPAPALGEAVTVLRTLGAVDDDGRATRLGHRLAAVPADPRLARGLLEGAPLTGARRAAEVVALLTGDHPVAGGDLAAALTQLRGGGDSGGRRGRRSHAGAWQRESRRLERIAGQGTPDIGADGAPAESVRGYEPGAVVALARPEWIARKDGGTYLLAGGTRAGLPAGSSLAHHEWLAVAEVSRAAGKAAGGTGATIRVAAPLDRAAAEITGATMLREGDEVHFGNGRLTARRVRALGAITLTSTPVKAEPQRAAEAVREALRRDGLGMLPWGEGSLQLRARLSALHRSMGDPWPAVDDDALLGRLEEWLGPEISAVARGGRIQETPLEPALRRLLPWPEAARLDELAPSRLPVPSGATARVLWDREQPVVRVKLQECFGLAESPRLLGGRVPVVFHLLSPAGRELAITSDLASFWAGPYAQVRAEMRGKYPKHPWPEDPWSTPATARTKARM